jgi:periplasmic protein TonB
MPSRVARTPSQQFRTGRFLLLSLLLHLLAVAALQLSLLVQDRPTSQAQERPPIQVSFARPEPTTEPEKPEVFAETSSRAQNPEGPKADTAKATETILPRERQAPAEPSPPIPPTPATPRADVRPTEEQPPAEVVPEPTPEPPAQPPPERREEKADAPDQPPVKPPRTRPEKPTAKQIVKAPEPKPTPVERQEPKRVAKLPEPKPPPGDRPEPKAVVPPTSMQGQQEPTAPLRPLPETVAQPDHSRPPLFGRIPLLSGDDLERYAQLRSSDQRSSAGDTVSLDTKELKYLSYFAHIKRRIERVWSYPQDAVANGLQGQLHLKFILARNGQVTNVELLRSSGFKVLDKEAWDAVVNAGPFGPFPAMISDEELHITARFSYVLDESVRRTRMR